MKWSKQSGSGSASTKPGRNRKDIWLFLFFLCISFMLWSLNSIQKEIEISIRYPIRFINLPPESKLIDQSVYRLTVGLKGPGSSILKLKLSGYRSSLFIDLNNVEYRHVKKQPGDFYILTASLRRSLPAQRMAHTEIISIKPDTLFFTLQR